MKKKKYDINSVEDAARILAQRKIKSDKRQMNKELMSDEIPFLEHCQCANLMVKVINVLKIDPRVKKVVSMRLLHPLTHGVERTHLSIALEMGCREADVREMEDAGMDALERQLATCSQEDFIKKFNSDRSLENTIKNQING